MTALLCPYCDEFSKVVGGDAIYPGRLDLALLKFHRCDPCDAHVGCHKPGAYVYVDGRRIRSDGTLPMGRLADAELRRAKMRAHDAFDPIWRDGGTPRHAAYLWLANVMGLSIDATHIGDFTPEQCRRVVEVCKQKERV